MLKLVPDVRPDDDGEWVTVDALEEDVNRADRTTSWTATMVLLSKYNPRKDHHIVAVETDRSIVHGRSPI